MQEFQRFWKRRRGTSNFWLKSREQMNLPLKVDVILWTWSSPNIYLMFRWSTGSCYLKISLRLRDHCPCDFHFFSLPSLSPTPSMRIKNNFHSRVSICLVFGRLLREALPNNILYCLSKRAFSYIVLRLQTSRQMYHTQRLLRHVFVTRWSRHQSLSTSRLNQRESGCRLTRNRCD